MITSRSHPLIKRFRKLRGSLPGDSRTTLIEGIRLIEEGLDSRVEFEALFFTPRIGESERGREILRKLKSAAGECCEVADEVMKSLSGEETPPGILAFVKVPEGESHSLNPPVLVLCGIRDPGNAGSLIRAAEGAGFSVRLSDDSVHPFHPKVVKGSMGSAFRVSIGRGALVPLLEKLKREKVALVGTRADSGVPYDRWNWTASTAVLLGGEAEGLPPGIEKYLDGAVSIPLLGKVESLNVAVAGGVLMFEARRQMTITNI